MLGLKEKEEVAQIERSLDLGDSFPKQNSLSLLKILNKKSPLSNNLRKSI